MSRWPEYRTDECMLSCSVMSNSLQPHQAPLSLGFSRQEHWSGLPFPPPGDLPDPGIEPVSPVAPAQQVFFLTAEPSGMPHYSVAGSSTSRLESVSSCFIHRSMGGPSALQSSAASLVPSLQLPSWPESLPWAFLPSVTPQTRVS